jgi:uncharacterized protein (TIGR01655 family)
MMKFGGLLIMKKSKTLNYVIIGAVVIALVVAVAIFGRKYYQDRYVGLDYYAMIPLDYDVTPETLLSSRGEDMGLGKEYTLTAYSADGTEKNVSFNVYAPGSQMANTRELPQPGQYLLVKASKTIVINWDIIEKSKVPEQALARLEG